MLFLTCLFSFCLFVFDDLFFYFKYVINNSHLVGFSSVNAVCLSGNVLPLPVYFSEVLARKYIKPLPLWSSSI